MIEEFEAAGLVQRFRAARGFDFLTAEGVDELTHALQSASSLDQAHEVTQWLIDHMPERPTPADIKARIAQTPASRLPPRDQSCRHCAGTGLRSVYLVGVDNGRRGTSLRRALCGSCAKSGNGCQALIVPLDIPDKSIGGMLYCEARAKQVETQGMTVVRACEPCPACRYGQARGLAYADREAEQQAKMEARRNGK